LGADRTWNVVGTGGERRRGNGSWKTHQCAVNCVAGGCRRSALAETSRQIGRVVRKVQGCKHIANETPPSLHSPPTSVRGWPRHPTHRNGSLPSIDKLRYGNMNIHPGPSCFNGVLSII
jgi:hypothetical protein